MKLRELLEINTNELDSIYVYYSQDAYDDVEPDDEFDGEGNMLPDTDLRSKVTAWYIDANFSLHVLLPYSLTPQMYDELDS